MLAPTYAPSVPERWGILGGTFDPVHVGHVVAAVDVRAACGLDRVVMVPAGDPWQKRGIVVATPEQRVAMVELACRDLDGVDQQTPVLLLSHIPFLSATAGMYARRNASGDGTVPGSWVHSDAERIKDLLARHARVKLCLSGHLHHVERIDHNNVTYLCNGAVSGNWWKGRHHDCDEGYAVIDLYDDGSFEHQYLTYGWKAGG